MKNILIITILALVISAGTCAWAQSAGTNLMKENIYGGTIDSKAAFYQKRIYLADSEYTILRDIGRDAIEKVSFLKAYRRQLIEDMAASNINLKQSSLNVFLLSKINNISTSLEAYSEE